MKQILEMLWTLVIGDKQVICALVTERQEDLVAIRALAEGGRRRAFVDRSFPLNEADRYTESGAKQGSVVIVLRPRATTGDKGAACRRFGGREMPYSGSASPVDPVSTSARTISRILSGSTIRGRQGGHQ